MVAAAAAAAAAAAVALRGRGCHCAPPLLDVHVAASPPSLPRSRL